MRDEFSVDPETMLQASARFDLESVELGSALNRLQATLGSLGDVCGNDDQGRKFAAGYDPNAEKLQQAMQNMTTRLADISRGLQVMGTNYQGGDAASQVRSGG